MKAIQMKVWFVAAALAFVVVCAPASHAQISSGPTAVALNATLAESLTLAVAPTTVTFNLVPSGTANGSSPVTITTTWVLGTNRTALNVYAYFTSGRPWWMAAATSSPRPALTAASTAAPTHRSPAAPVRMA